MSPGSQFTEAEQQLRQARVELEQRLRAGEPVHAEGLLAAYPGLAAHKNSALELIYTEFVLREELGQSPSPEEWYARFPQWREDLEQLFEVHHFLRQDARGEAGGAQTLSSTDAGGRTLPAGPPREHGFRDYELLGVIGHGGMGIVYRARQVSLDRIVALKMVLAAEHATVSDLARFRTEAEAVARLQHPNIVQIYEVGEHQGRPFFSLEFVDGGSLASKLAGPSLPASQAAELVEKLARAMDYAHGRGILHRDLKPGNVLRTADGIPKITDFGLAKRLGGAEQTATGSVLGTPSYMAPEQAEGKTKQVGPAADVYGLGAILYECLTSRPPFQEATPLDTLLQVRCAEPVPPSHFQPQLPRDLETICLKCLEKDPGKRYPSALHLAEDLGRFLRDEPIVAHPPSAVYRFRKFARRNRGLVVGTAAVFLALVLGLTGTSLGLTRAWAERARAVEAERKARELLADSYAGAGQLAMQRGAWRTALDNLDRALEAGHPSSVALRLHKVRAWCAVHEVAQAEQELQALLQEVDLGEYEGPVRLWQADIALNRSDDDARALELVQQALKTGLPDPEAAYARGLLAKTSPEAVRHFQEAVERDAFHPRANGMLTVTLIALGRLPEARERVRLAGLLFPEDPTFHLLHALILVLEGDLPAGRAALEKARAQLGDRQLKTAWDLLDSVHQFRQLEGLGTGVPEISRPGLVLKILPPATRFLVGVRALRGGEAGTSSDLLLPIPPVFLRGFRPAAKAMPLALLGNYDRVIEELGRAVAVHPEGLLYYLLGLLLAEKGRLAEAEEAFLRAVRTPSIVPVQGAALYSAAAAEWLLADGPPPRPEMKARAAVNTKLLVAGGVRVSQAKVLASIAIDAGEWDLARWIIAEWERQAPPEDLWPLRKRMLVEFKAGAYGPARAAAERLLARQPGDEKARKEAEQIRAASDRFLEQSKPLGRPD